MSLRSCLKQSLVGAALAGVTVLAGAQTSEQPRAATDPSPRASAAAEAAFLKADANHDGKLSKEEAARLPGVAAKFDQLDKDKKGYLTLEQFAAGYKGAAD